MGNYQQLTVIIKNYRDDQERSTAYSVYSLAYSLFGHAAERVHTSV